MPRMITRLVLEGERWLVNSSWLTGCDNWREESGSLDTHLRIKAHHDEDLSGVGLGERLCEIVGRLGISL